MLIGLVAEGEGGEEERESHSKVGTLLGPTNIVEHMCFEKLPISAKSISCEYYY